VDDEIEAHSSLGPSAAHRYRRCPGAPNLEAQVPNKAGIEAAYGTCFHEAAAICLEFGIDPELLIGMKINVPPHGDIEFTNTMARHMQPGLDYMRAMIGPDDLFVVERRVNLEPWLGPKQFGTTDASVISLLGWKIVIFDWKYGAGHPVSPIENDQGILYFAGVWNDYAQDIFDPVAWEQGVDPWDAGFYDSIEVQIIIEQPRAPGGGGIWVTNVGELLRRLEVIKADAAKTKDPNAPRIPGAYQCTFCNGKPFCKEYQESILSHFDAKLDSLEEAFDEVQELTLPKAITPKARSQILLHRSMIESWLKDLHAAAYEDAENGREVPGMKLVDGRRSARAWKDEAKASIVMTKFLGEKAYNKKLLSPTQVEEEVGKVEYRKRYEGFALLGDSKPQLVADEDNRKARADRMSRFDTALDDDAGNLI
jgi:hypothetical protein